MNLLQQHVDQLPSILGKSLKSSTLALREITCEIDAVDIVSVCNKLRDHVHCQYHQLIDLCGVDYSEDGKQGGES